jgi:UDP-perosamine 4-acetyltransferase
METLIDEESMDSRRPIVLMGGGGHARVVADLVRACGLEIYGVIDPDEESARRRLPLERFLAPEDSFVEGLDRSSVYLAMGIGAKPLSPVRRLIFKRFTMLGFEFPRLVHPSARVAADAVLSAGVQVMAGAVVQSGASIGACAVINTSSTVDHECALGEFVHIAPAATLCGCVTIGHDSFIGPGSTIFENVSIGDGSVVGAGSVVTRNLAAGVRAWGVPAKPQ